MRSTFGDPPRTGSAIGRRALRDSRVERVVAPHRFAGVACVLLALSSAFLAACGGDDDQAASTTTEPETPTQCVGPPTTVTLEAAGERPAGGETFEVTDAVARRVAILPGEMAFDPASLSGLENKAAVTPLAMYTLYLADFRLPDDELAGVGFGEVVPPAGKTVGALTMVPQTEAGFTEGDVVTDGEFDYELRTTLTPLGLTVFTDGDTTGQAYTDVTGQAEILQLDDESICVDFDVTYENQGEQVYRAKGVVQAPVVRAADAFFFT
jgi:hypothetical protein